MKKIVAVTACVTGIAHTYMAAELLIKSAQKLNITMHVETQGAMGTENKLNPLDIARADLVLIVSDIKIDEISRFQGCRVEQVSIESVLNDVNAVLTTVCNDDS